MVGKLLSSHLNAIAREREDNGWAEKKLQPPKLFRAKVLFKLDSKDGMQIHTNHCTPMLNTSTHKIQMAYDEKYKKEYKAHSVGIPKTYSDAKGSVPPLGVQITQRLKMIFFLIRRAPLRELDVRFVFSLSLTTLNSRSTFCGSLFHWVANKTHDLIFFVNSTSPFNRNSTSCISINVYLASPSY